MQNWPKKCHSPINLFVHNSPCKCMYYVMHPKPNIVFTIFNRCCNRFFSSTKGSSALTGVCNRFFSTKSSSALKLFSTNCVLHLLKISVYLYIHPCSFVKRDHPPSLAFSHTVHGKSFEGKTFVVEYKNYNSLENFHGRGLVTLAPVELYTDSALSNRSTAYRCDKA